MRNCHARVLTEKNTGIPLIVPVIYPSQNISFSDKIGGREMA